MKKRLLSIVLAIALALPMVVGLLPTSAEAAGTSVRAVVDGVSALKGKQGSTVYLGSYMQSKNSQGGWNMDAIQWRVLSTDGKKVLLLSDKNLDTQKYFLARQSINWEKSTIRSWLNGYDGTQNKAKADYTVENFINKAFNAQEQAAITTSFVKNNERNEYTSLYGGNDTYDKLFFLSYRDAKNTSYGFSDSVISRDDARKAKNTAYVATFSGMNAAGTNDRWWLRGPGHLMGDAVAVATSGALSVEYGLEVDCDTVAVRPAMNLDASQVLLSSGKYVKMSGEGKLTVLGTSTDNNWKLTLLDSARSSFTAETLGRNDRDLTIKYSGALTGTNEYISVLIADNTGGYIYYGRVKKLTDSSMSSGEAVIRLPNNTLPTGSKIYIYNEQYNGGDMDNNMFTDLASQLVEVALNPVTVTFDLQGHGSPAPDAQVIEMDEKVTAPAINPTEKGYTFQGWYKEPGCFNEWDFNADTVEVNTVIYAKWSANSYIDNKKIMTGISGIEGGQQDNVFYGQYQQSSNGSGGFLREPIKWRVLSDDDGYDLLMLADKGLDEAVYNDGYGKISWETSTIRSWLNGLDDNANAAGQDFTSKGFVDNAFTGREITALAGGAVTDRVFLISEADAGNAAYGFVNDDSRVAVVTAYTGSKIPTSGTTYLQEGEPNDWWLSNMNDDGDSAAYVDAKGKIMPPWPASMGGQAVRPAVVLPLYSVAFTSAAEGGKAGTLGTISEIGTYENGTDWKVTLNELSRNSFRAASTQRTGDVLTVEYKMAQTGVSEYISVMIADNKGTYTHYGRIKELTDGATDGTVEITLPSGLPVDSKIYVFNEKYLNGDNDTKKLTDYSSELIEVDADPATYLVTFDMKGHGDAPDAQTLAIGGKVSRPTDPAVDGYTFGGWYTDSDCTTPWDFITAVTEDMTLYAGWTVNTYTVKFNGNGGTGTMADQSFTYDQAQALSANAFTNTGYKFDGWTTNADGSGCKYRDQETLLNLTNASGAVVNLYAKWDVISYKVNFDMQGHGTEISEQTIEHGQKASEPVEPFETGYTFTGWFKDQGCGTPWDFTTDTITNETVLYAGWTANKYTVVFNGNGSDSGSMSPQQFEYDTALNLTANAFVKTAFTFEAWNTAADGTGTTFADQENVQNLTDVAGDVINLYVQWTHPTHAFGTDWVSNDEVHWHECVCGEKADVEKHAAVGAYVCTEDQKCAKCGYVMKAAQPHNMQTVPGKAPTCEDTGLKAYFSCPTCGKYYEDKNGAVEITNIDSWKIIPAKGHQDNDGDGYCDTCGKLVKLFITKGENQTYVKGGKSDVTITCNGKFGDFTGLQLDGANVDAGNYTAVSGSTIATLKGSYLETLSLGVHKVTFLYNNGSATTTLTVKDGSQPTPTNPTQPTKPGGSTQPTSIVGPGTGDTSSLSLWICLAAVAAAAIVVAVIVVVRKGRKR